MRFLISYRPIPTAFAVVADEVLEFAIGFSLSLCPKGFDKFVGESSSLATTRPFDRDGKRISNRLSSWQSGYTL